MRSLPLYTAMFVCVSVSQLGLDKRVHTAFYRIAVIFTLQSEILSGILCIRGICKGLERARDGPSRPYGVSKC